MAAKNKDQLLPWNNVELEMLLRELIAHGSELAKADFKAEIELSTVEQKAELLKDITAIANTYDDENYNDYGFLVYGVKAKAIIGIAQTEPDTDKLQNTVEQLLKTYVSPMPQVYVMGFETEERQKWGVIVVPPRNGKPHMFFKDLQCRDPKCTKLRGDWFVRRGSTTDCGLPEDLALIMQRQTDAAIEPLRESIRVLQTRVGKTEEQYNSALFKLVERAISGLPKNTEEIEEAVGADLPTRLKRKLRTPKDAIAEDLIAEARILQEYLEGAATGLTWTPQLTDSDENKKIIEAIEDHARAFQLSVATIVLSDSTGVYTNALLRSIKLLAKIVEPPNGTMFNNIGKAIRYYPLGLIVYTIAACSAAANRGDILKQALAIPLKHPIQKGETLITDIFYFWYDARSFFNSAFNGRACEPIPQRIRQVIGDRIGEMIPDLSESEYFFRGEFLLALSGIDTNTNRGGDAAHRTPIHGLYLYMSDAQEPIEGLLLEYPNWLDKIYAHPLNELLDSFDRNAPTMGISSGCIAMGLHGLKTREYYDEGLRRRLKKQG